MPTHEFSVRDTSFMSYGYRLAGTLYEANETKASALFLGGGGLKPRQETHYPEWQRFFAEHGISTLHFDFRGIGESEGTHADSSLSTRSVDAFWAFQSLKDHVKTERTYIVGTSMGGPTAIELLLMTRRSAYGLVLLAPAAYAHEAQSVRFGPAFSDIIRRPDSWRRTEHIKELSTALYHFDSRVLLVYGSEDEVIPKEILERYAKNVQAYDGEVILLEGEGHRSWKNASEVLSKIVDFMLE